MDLWRHVDFNLLDYGWIEVAVYGKELESEQNIKSEL
jgi:hypothetical protein